MSNDPHDVDSQAYSDRCANLDQNAMRLEEVGKECDDTGAKLRVVVSPCEDRGDGTLYNECEIYLELDGANPLLHLANTLQGLVTKTIELLDRDHERAREGKQEA